MERKSRRKNKGRQIKILDGDSRDTYTHKLRGRIIRSDPSRLTQSGRREGKRTGLHTYLPTYIRPFIHAQSLRTDRHTETDSYRGCSHTYIQPGTQTVTEAEA